MLSVPCRPGRRRDQVRVGRRSPGTIVRVLVTALLCAVCAVGWPALADPQPAVFSGVPQQVVPTYAEVGLGSFTMPTGNSSLLGGSTGSGSGTGTDTGSLVGHGGFLGDWQQCAEHHARAELGVSRLRERHPP